MLFRTRPLCRSQTLVRKLGRGKGTRRSHRSRRSRKRREEPASGRVSLSQSGPYQEAQIWFERAIKEKEQGDLAGRVDSDSLGRSLHSLGVCLAESGNHEGAKSWFELAIADLQKGDLQKRIDHNFLGKSFGYLALCHARIGNLGETLSLRERAVAEHRQGDYHGRVDKSSLATSLRLAASYLRQLNRIPDAEAYEAEANQLDARKLDH